MQVAVVCHGVMMARQHTPRLRVGCTEGWDALIANDKDGPAQCCFAAGVTATCVVCVCVWVASQVRQRSWVAREGLVCPAMTGSLDSLGVLAHVCVAVL